MTYSCRDEVTSSLQPILGEDGSQTFFNTKYKEAYHSKIGAITEALHKFVKPSALESLLSNNKSAKVLDLFFGLGYNSGVCIDYACKISQELPTIEITAIEKDIEIINKIKGLEVPSWYTKWRDLLATPELIQYKNITIKLYIDCIFNKIDELPKDYFDIIFFDPFSHKVAPEFWTPDFLTLVFQLLSKSGTLTTYSGLKKVEKLAVDLGLTTKKVPAIGRKKDSLLIINN